MVSDATQELVEELKARFPSQGVMDALSIVYHQYWQDSQAVEKSFRKHLDIIKSQYGQPKWIGESDKQKLIPPLLDCYNLELQ